MVQPFVLEAKGPRSFLPARTENHNVMLKSMKLDHKRTIRAYFAPIFLEAEDGTHLIFAQGRINSSKDKTEKVVVMVRSLDGGKNWTRPQVIADPHRVIHEMVAYKNPLTGRIWVMFQGVWKNKKGKVTQRKMIRFYSDDHGRSWSDVYNETLESDKSFGLYEWNQKGERFTTFQPTGMPVLLKGGAHKGRMVLSGYGHIESQKHHKKSRAVLSLYSDDGGENWVKGFPQDETLNGVPPFAGESSLVELQDGRLLMIIRPHHKDLTRYKTYSLDGGVTWSKINKTKDLDPVPVFQSVTRYSGINDGRMSLLLLSMPQLNIRMKGSVYYSFNEGVSWKRKTVVWGFFDYSDIKVLKDGRIAVTYSRGGHGPFGVNIAYFSLKWLLK